MKRPTLSDIAAAAGVSRSSAARVLLGTGGEHVRVADATRGRIEAAAKRLRYAPNRSAQQLRGVSSRTIGVILDTINLPVMSQRLFALESEASRRGYRLLVGRTHGDDGTLREYVSDFSGRGVEAILSLFDLHPGRDARVRPCFGAYRSVVFHGRPAWPGGYCIRVDTEDAIRKCVEHFASRGRKRLSLSLGNFDNDELMALRKTVFEQSVAQCGVKGVVWNSESEAAMPSPEILERGIAFMVDRCRSDAILASNDIWATRFILELQKRSRKVPGEVAVIGYDNLDIASVVSPALTTIDQCHQEYAASALELLLKISAGRRIPLARRIVTIQPQLIIRESA